MKYTGSINITNKTDESVIDIDGVIGVPEWWQFDNPDDKVSTYDKFKQKLNEIKNISAKKVTVNIRSIGGSVNDAFLIHDSLVELNAKITTVCFGYTASAATILSQAGNKRKISSNSLYLIHLASTFRSGNKNDLRESLQVLEKTDDRIASLYEARGGNNADFYKEIMSRSNGNGEWLSPQEALDYGLVDEIVNSVSISNICSNQVSNYHLPSIPEDKIIKENTNQNLENMKVKIQDGWKYITDFFGWNSGEEKEITSEHIHVLNNKCQELRDSITTITNEKTALEDKIGELSSEITNLKTDKSGLETKISNLESELAQAKADPTKTKDKEDPNILDEKPSGNKGAYDDDIKNFNE